MKNFITILPIFFCCYVQAQTTKFYIPYRDGNKWGYCDTLGKIKIKPQYTTADFFETKDDSTYYNIAKVTINNSVFLIDSNGKALTPLNYNNANFFVNDNEYCFLLTNKEGLSGVYKKNQFVIPCIYESIYQLNNIGYYKVYKNNKQGILSNDGKIIVPILFDNIVVSKKKSNATNIVLNAYENEKVSNYTLHLNKSLNEKDFLNFEFDYNEVKDENVSTYTKQNGNASAVVDTSIAEDYKEEMHSIDINNKLNDSAALYKKQFSLDSIQIIDTRGFYYVEKNGKQGLLDDSLKIFYLDKKYDIQSTYINYRSSWLYTTYQSLGLFVIKKGDLYGLINEFEDVILELKYSYINIEQSDGVVNFYTIDNKQSIIIIETPKRFKFRFYRYLSLSRKLWVNDGWVFYVFKGMFDDGNEVFFGDNGVDYFRNIKQENQKPNLYYKPANSSH